LPALMQHLAGIPLLVDLETYFCRFWAVQFD
jgi:hypothetical protein